MPLRLPHVHSIRSRFTEIAIWVCLLVIVCAIYHTRSWWSRWAAAPGNVYSEALSSMERGHDEPLFRAAEVLEKSAGFEQHAQYLRGLYLARRGEPELALEELTASKPTGAVRDPSLLLICEILYGRGQLAQAEVIARQLAAETPNHPDAHRWLAAILFDLGASNAAIAELGRVIELAPSDFRPRWLLAVIYYDFENYAEAAKQCEKALELGAPEAIRKEILAKLSESLVKTRDYQHALDLLTQKGADGHGLALQAECKWSLGDKESAMQLLKRAENLAPDDRGVLLLRARVEQEDGDPQVAIDRLQQQLTRDQHDFECRFRLAQLLRRLGRIEQAEQESQRMQQSKELRQRLAELSDSAADQPDDAQVRDQIAELCAQLGKDELALIYRTAAENCRQAAALKSSAARDENRSTKPLSQGIHND